MADARGEVEPGQTDVAKAGRIGPLDEVGKAAIQRARLLQRTGRGAGLVEVLGGLGEVMADRLRDGPGRG